MSCLQAITLDKPLFICHYVNNFSHRQRKWWWSLPGQCLWVPSSQRPDSITPSRSPPWTDHKDPPCLSGWCSLPYASQPPEPLFKYVVNPFRPELHSTKCLLNHDSFQFLCQWFSNYFMSTQWLSNYFMSTQWLSNYFMSTQKVICIWPPTPI